MCWASVTLNKQVAKQDYTVYKFVKFDTFDTCKSSVYNYTYTFEKLNKLEQPLIPTKKDSIYIIDKGFHSYINLKIIYFTEDVTKGCVAECTIPKGAIYYTNAYGEVVSNQIIIHIPTILSNIKQFIENNK